MKEIKFFTKEDRELLKTPIPTSPCKRCGMGWSCCGCQLQREYDHAVEKYKENSILQYALNIREIIDNKEKISDLEYKIKNIVESFPEEIKDIAEDMAKL